MDPLNEATRELWRTRTGPDWRPPADRRTPIDRILVKIGLGLFVVEAGLLLIGVLLVGLVDSSDTWQTADFGGKAAFAIVLVGAAVAFVVGAAMVSIRLGERYEGLNDPPRSHGAWASPTWPGASTTVARYLWEVNAELRLPPGIAAEALEVAATQIYAAIAIADPLGQHDEATVVKVLSTFGQPADAARWIKAYQHLLPRPVLGLAAGLVAMVSGAVAACLMITLFTLPVGFVWPSGSSDTTAMDFFAAALVLDFVAFYAARRAVRVSAAISRLRAIVVGRSWAMVCAPFLAGPVIVLAFHAASIPQVVAQLGIPLAFALGATAYVDRPWPIRP